MPRDHEVEDPMTFDANERAWLAGWADVLIPAGNDFPSASQAGVANEGLDQVLAFRPDLAAPLKNLLAQARGRSAAEFVGTLQRDDPASFAILAEFVPGAYFLNTQVRAKLGYSGQRPQPIDPHPDYLDDGLLRSVIDRGPIYRPTPAPPTR
jgi:hypothetical protein